MCIVQAKWMRGKISGQVVFVRYALCMHANYKFNNLPIFVVTCEACVRETIIRKIIIKKIKSRHKNGYCTSKQNVGGNLCWIGIYANYKYNNLPTLLQIVRRECVKQSFKKMSHHQHYLWVLNEILGPRFTVYLASYIDYPGLQVSKPYWWWKHISRFFLSDWIF